MYNVQTAVFRGKFNLPIKGQLISKCPFGVFKSSKKKPTKILPGFLPWPVKEVKSKK